MDNPSTESVDTDEETESVNAKDTEGQNSVHELEESYTTDLERMLNEIEGVSEASVLINLDSTDIKIYERNLIKGQQTTEEKDTNGGNRKVEDHTEETETVLVRQGDQ